MTNEYIETLINLYESFVLHYKEHLLDDVKTEYLEGIYEGKIKAYSYVISDLKGLLGDSNE